MSNEQFDALAWAKRAAEALRACHNWMQGEFSDSDFDRDGKLSEADAAAFSAAYDADKAIAAIALMRGQSEEKPMEPNMDKTIYDLAVACGADVDGGEYPDPSSNFPGSPPTIWFTDRQLEMFAEKLLDGSYLYVGGERQLTSDLGNG